MRCIFLNNLLYVHTPRDKYRLSAVWTRLSSLFNGKDSFPHVQQLKHVLLHLFKSQSVEVLRYLYILIILINTYYSH